MADTVFIEILDDTRLRVFAGDAVSIVDNAWLSEVPSRAQVVLLDSLHIRSKTFTRRVNDKRILPQVIAADISDYLLQNREDYLFAHTTIDDTIWVSWVEKLRFVELQRRFEAVAGRVTCLVATPLLAGLLAQRLDADTVFLYAPLVYGVIDGETTVMTQAQADNWLLNEQQTAQQPLRGDAGDFYNAAAAGKLPNLWQQRDRFVVVPYGRWVMLGVLGTGLWIAHAYLDYRRAQWQNQQAYEVQLQLLHQVFPNAQSGDPYGRMKAEWHHRESNDTPAKAVLERLDAALAGHRLTLSSLSLAIDRKALVLYGDIEAARQQQLLRRLQRQGFSIGRDTNDTNDTETPSQNYGDTKKRPASRLVLTWE